MPTTEKKEGRGGKRTVYSGLELECCFYCLVCLRRQLMIYAGLWLLRCGLSLFCLLFCLMLYIFEASLNILDDCEGNKLVLHVQFPSSCSFLCLQYTTTAKMCMHQDRRKKRFVMELNSHTWSLEDKPRTLTSSWGIRTALCKLYVIGWYKRTRENSNSHHLE